MGLIFNGNGDVIKAVDGSLTVEGLDFGGISNVNAGIGTFSGNLNVGGVLTYEDVKNVDSVGIVTARDHINIVTDNKKLQVGAGQDLTLHHDGTHSYITNTTGDLRIVDTTGMLLRSNSLDLRNGAGTENYITCAANGAVSLYYDNSKKFETTNTGATITGALNLTGASSGNYINVGSSTVYANAAINIYRLGNGYADMRLSSNYGAKVGLAGASNNTDELYIQQDNQKNAYVWNKANKHIAFGTNNTARMWLANNGNFRVVGISTFNSSVHVDGDLDVAADIRHIGDTDTRLRFETDTISARTAGSERLRINSSGQVSIGNNPTVASDAALHIELDGTREYLRLEGDGGTSNAYLEIEAPNNRRKAIIFKSGGTRRGVIGVGDSDEAANATNLFFTASSNIAGDSPHMIITSSGRVVIGDTDTDNAVTDSDNLVIGAASGDNGLTIVSQSGNYNGTIRFSDGANSGSDSYRGTIQYYHGDNYMRFYTNAVERLRINSSGAFGLGGATYGSSGQVLTSAGSGSAPTWSTVSGTTINTNANNRIITGSGTANTLNGESNLTYDGSQITSTVSANDKGLKIVSTGNHGHLIEFQSNRTGADNILGIIGGKWDSNQVAQIRFMTGTDTTNKDEGAIGFHIMEPGGTMERRFMLNQSGKLKMSGTGNANSTDEGVIHVENKQANDPYITDLMDEFMGGSAFNSTSDGRATVRVEWAKGYAQNDTTQANVGLLIDGLSAYSGPSIGVCSWARAQVGNGGGINFYGRQESVYGLDYGFYGYRKRSPSSGYGQVFTAEVESALLATNYGMKILLKARTGSDSYAQGIWIEEANSGTRHAMKFTRGGTEKGSIKTTSSATQFNTSSDYRLKENNVPITDGIARVKQLKPYRFNWKGETDVVDGFFAHEAQTVVPESVSGTKDEVKNVYPDTASPENPTPDPIGTEPEYQQMDHSKLVPLLTAALKEAITEIENLKAEVAALKSS